MSNGEDPLISSPNPGPQKKRRPTNFVWKAVYTESLFQYLIQAIENGERGNKFKSAATYISQLYDLQVTKENVANHLRTWKAKWNRICRLKKLSGVSWDDDQKIIIMGEVEARTYLEVL